MSNSENLKKAINLEIQASKIWIDYYQESINNIKGADLDDQYAAAHYSQLIKKKQQEIQKAEELLARLVK